MITRPKEPFLNKRWVYSLSKLELTPFRYPDEESKNYEKDVPNVGNLEAPNLIISEEIYEKISKKTTRRYALFENYVQVYRLCEHLRNNGNVPHFYEICPYYMKIHFDIDLKLESENEGLFKDNNRYNHILRPCLESIDEVFSKMFPSHYSPSEFVDNMLVFEAHRAEKISFHVVVDGFYLSCKEVDFFYREVVDEMARKGYVQQSKMVDYSVYKKNQAFRLFGSNKATMSGREGIKKVYDGPAIELPSRGLEGSLGCRIFSRERMFSSCFRNEDDKCDRLRDLRISERSLLSHTLGSVHLTISTKVLRSEGTPRISREVTLAEPLAITDDELSEVLKVFFQHPCSKTENGDSAFCYMKYIPRGGYIYLKRTKSSYCEVCKKRHEAENAFLTLSVGGEVQFVCRRAQESKRGGSSTYIGQMRLASQGPVTIF
jgi:hypothetical protein